MKPEGNQSGSMIRFSLGLETTGANVCGYAGQLLIYRAVANAVDGIPSADDTAIAKAFCNQAGFDICSEAMQVMGGMGYTEETLVEYCFRKCRGWMIAGRSIEILKNRIAESVFERSFSQHPPKPGKA